MLLFKALINKHYSMADSSNDGGRKTYSSERRSDTQEMGRYATNPCYK